MAVARARFDGTTLTDLLEIFVARLRPPPRRHDWRSGSTARCTSLRPLMTFVPRIPTTTGGKILRLKDDGSMPPDNPFVKRTGYLPEIFSLGHRSQVGIAVHPETGAVWSTEHGRQGGDEVNVNSVPARNYGWPILSYGRDYGGPAPHRPPGRMDSSSPLRGGCRPSRSRASRFIRATGSRPGKATPSWAACSAAASRGPAASSELCSTAGEKRSAANRCLTELKKRVRDVRQGPDGLLYVLVEDDAGGPTGGETALLRIQSRLVVTSARPAKPTQMQLRLKGGEDWRRIPTGWPGKTTKQYPLTKNARKARKLLDRDERSKDKCNRERGEEDSPQEYLDGARRQDEGRARKLVRRRVELPRGA